MKHTTFLATTAAAAFFATGAMAASVSIDIIDASWNEASVVGGEGTATVTDTATSTTLSWGVPGSVATNPLRLPSSYVFTPTAPLPFGASPDTPFSLGTFTHNNYAILLDSNDDGVQDGAITFAALDFMFGGTPEGGALVTFTAIFNFEHDETRNAEGECIDPDNSVGVPCDDFVTVSAVGGATEVVRVGNLVYTFTLLGFSPDGTEGSFTDTFRTAEGEANISKLWAVYEVAPIPLPAAGWLLLGGLGALGVAARRRRKDA